MRWSWRRGSWGGGTRRRGGGGGWGGRGGGGGGGRKGVNGAGGGGGGLVGTVGRMEVGPNASNVVPGVVRLSVDVRHEADEVRRAAVAGLMQRGEAMAREGGCGFEFRVDGDFATVPMDP